MPLLTLTSDIGQQDYMVGAIKGQLVSTNPTLNIVDITHYLPQDNFPHVAYICSNAFKYFPKNTFHFLLVNVFETKGGHFILAEYNEQFIICPDNGILTMITGSIPKKVVTLPIINASTFLEITQIVANAVTAIINGKNIHDIGTNALSITEKLMLKPMIGNDWIEGQILFIDNFENVIINITREEFEKERRNRKFKIVFKRNEVIDSLSHNYASVDEGNNLAHFNSAGYLELSINKGNMAGLFGLKNYNEKMQQQGHAVQNNWFYQTVRVFFE
ncbi:MAG: SAM-dependent chlorinase/fluorinase [Chitinophagaceae bacterium]|nr:SAM-dependent chlorinase/fluorinase [Chitinophagaceae bacterium]